MEGKVETSNNATATILTPVNSTGRKVTNSSCRTVELATKEHAMALGIDPEYVNTISICDSRDGLIMFHYNDGFELSLPSEALQVDSSLSWGDQAGVLEEKKDRVKRTIMRIRGVILSEEGELVCRSFSAEDIILSGPKLEDYVREELEFMRFLEGATIRLFWWGEKWYFSTYRSIDCSRSKSPDFMALFNEASPDFDFEQLDKNMSYIFQIVHEKTQVMNQDPIAEARVYHLATMKRGDREKLTMEYEHENSGLKGVHYLKKLTRKQAGNQLRRGRFILIRDGLDIAQVAPEAKKDLMRIRGYFSETGASMHVPVKLMYLRLNLSDRPKLNAALPPHQKAECQPVAINKWIESNVDGLSNFLANFLLCRITKVETPRIGKTLMWALKQVKLEDRSISFQEIRQLYREKLIAISETNGESFYRLTRELVSHKKWLERTGTETPVPGKRNIPKKRTKNIKVRKKVKPRENSNTKSSKSYYKIDAGAFK